MAKGQKKNTDGRQPCGVIDYVNKYYESVNNPDYESS